MLVILRKKYEIKSMKMNTEVEELEQRLVGKAVKIKRYEQFKPNCLVKTKRNFTSNSTTSLDRKALSLMLKHTKLPYLIYLAGC